MVVLEEKGNIKTLVPSHGLCETDLEELINEYEKELRYFAYKIVRDWIIVDDIMQEVFIKIFLKLDSFEKDLLLDRGYIKLLIINASIIFEVKR